MLFFIGFSNPFIKLTVTALETVSQRDAQESNQRRTEVFATKFGVDDRKEDIETCHRHAGQVKTPQKK